MKRLLQQLRGMFGKPDELKRPSFPVDEKYREKRGDVNNVKPLFRRKQKPIDYDRSPPPV